MSQTLHKAEALQQLERERQRLGLEPEDCMMCALTHGGHLGDIVDENDAGIVVLDRFGSRPGHLLVVSRAHVHSAQELGWSRYAQLQKLAFDASAALDQVLSPVRVWLAALGAPDAVPMSFPHYHVHVLPIHERGESSRPARVFSWSEGVVTYDEAEALLLTRELRAALPSQRVARRVA